MEGTAAGYRGRKLPDHNFILIGETEVQKMGRYYRCSPAAMAHFLKVPVPPLTAAPMPSIHMCKCVILWLTFFSLKSPRVQGHNDLSTSQRGFLKWSQGV